MEVDLLTVFKLLFQSQSLLQGLFIAERISEGNVGGLSCIIIEMMGKCNVKALIPIVKRDLVRYPFPLLLLVWQYPVNWLQPSLVQFSLVVHIPH